MRGATPPDLPEDPDVEVFGLGEHEADGEGFSHLVREGVGHAGLRRSRLAAPGPVPGGLGVGGGLSHPLQGHDLGRGRSTLRVPAGHRSTNKLIGN